MASEGAAAEAATQAAAAPAGPTVSAAAGTSNGAPSPGGIEMTSPSSPSSPSSHKTSDRYSLGSSVDAADGNPSYGANHSRVPMGQQGVEGEGEPEGAGAAGRTEGDDQDELDDVDLDDGEGSGQTQAQTPTSPGPGSGLGSPSLGGLRARGGASGAAGRTAEAPENDDPSSSTHGLQSTPDKGRKEKKTKEGREDATLPLPPRSKVWAALMQSENVRDLSMTVLHWRGPIIIIFTLIFFAFFTGGINVRIYAPTIFQLAGMSESRRASMTVSD